MTQQPPRPITRRLIVEPDADGFLGMDHDGDVRNFQTACDVVRFVKRRDARDPSGFVVTAIEWRNMPEGFEPPETTQ